MSREITMNVICAGQVDMTIHPAKIIGKNIEKYVGNYHITPSMQRQSLQTAEKLVAEDIIINEIPVYRTQNLSGGYTVIIGG